MLQNFVTDADLRRYFPKISNYLWSTQADYSTQIAEAFELVLDDLNARGLDARKMHVPIDLNRPAGSSVAQNVLAEVAKQAGDDLFSLHVVGLPGYRRFFVNCIQTAGQPPSITLQGSNDVNVTDSIEPVNWTSIATLTLASGVQQSVVFAAEYRYYRWVLSSPEETTAFTAALFETYVDRWVIWRTFQMIFEDFSKEAGDLWDQRAQMAEKRYQQSLASTRFSVDSNEDNLVDDADDPSTSAEIEFSR